MLSSSEHHEEAARLITLARGMLVNDQNALAVTYLDLAVSAISSREIPTAYEELGRRKGQIAAD